MEESVCSVLFFLEVVTRDDMKWKASLIIRLLFNIVWLKSFCYKFAHFFLPLHVQLWFLQLFCADSNVFL